MNETYNIHQILNEFERYFKHKRTHIKVSHTDGLCIYVQVYLSPRKPPYWDDAWNKDQIKDKYLNTKQENYYMLRLWVNREENRMLEYSDWDLILFKDNIYMNKYTMPDRQLALDFWKAKEAWTTCPADHLFTQYGIKLSTKQLNQIRSATRYALSKHLKELKNIKRLSTFHDVQQHIKSDLTLLQFLYLGPYGSDTPEDETFKSMIYPDFCKYKKPVA